MALRHLLLRFAPRLSTRWIIGALVVATLVGLGTFIRWEGPTPPMDLVALGPDGRFHDTLRVPADWADTAASSPDVVARVPLMLAVRNRGTRAVTPERLHLSLPMRYRLTEERGRELEGREQAGSPLVTYTLRPGLDAVQPQRLPALLPAHDTLWLEVVVPEYYCVEVADSIPEFVPAPPPPVQPLSDVRIFYSFEGGDLDERRTGTLAVRMDTVILSVEMPPDPPSFAMRTDPEAANPELGALQRVGSRRSRCGEPEAPMELLSTVWETPGGGRFITLDYGGTVRKHLYDLDGDGVIERESWDPAGTGTFPATRRARLPIPAFLLPREPSGAYDMARFDSIAPDSLARLDPFRRAMPGPGPVPGQRLGTGVDSARRALLRSDTAPGAPSFGEERAPSLDELPEPRIQPAGPLGRPVRDDPPPDTGGG